MQAELSKRGWLLYCRAGFEAECGLEARDLAMQQDAGSWLRADVGSAFVRLATPQGSIPHPADGALIFARQALNLLGALGGLDPRDRLRPVLDLAAAGGARYADVWIETPDSAAGGEWSALARSLTAPARHMLRAQGLFDPASPQRLHVLVVDGRTLIVARAEIARASRWPRGLPRLRFPAGAPSRSALKLEEALLTLLDARERAAWLTPGASAVDLGAAPGGWSWQLVRRHLRVTAIDNGALDPALLRSGLVKHVRADGFRWLPRRPVDWLVCDMIERPARVTELIGRWLVEGHARRALFNLKLPMKKRLEAVRANLATLHDRLQARGLPDIRARHLYHDREEVTIYAALTPAPRPRPRA